VSDVPITIGGFYGYAQGPTWPRARQLSDQVLETFTQQLVIGMDGIRLIVGDFNHEPGELVQQRVWQRYGWVNAQTLGISTLEHEWTPTCKHATERDQIWLSPEAACLMRKIALDEHFADHKTISIQLVVPTKQTQILKWPRPTKIPWEKLDCKGWQPTCSTQAANYTDATTFLVDWANEFEDAISNQLQQQQHFPLSEKCRGRATRLHPVQQQLDPVICKPSREGEVSTIPWLARLFGIGSNNSDGCKAYAMR
jgi:hypothetical protein